MSYSGWIQQRARQLAEENNRLKAENAELVQALELICQAYSDNIEIMPVFFQTYISAAEIAIDRAKC